MAIRPKKRELINTSTEAKPGYGDQGDQRKASTKRKQAAKTSAKNIPIKSTTTRAQPAKSSLRTSRGTLVYMTGDETDEELDQMVDKMLEALGFKNKKKKKRAAPSHNRL